MLNAHYESSTMDNNKNNVGDLDWDSIYDSIYNSIHVLDIYPIFPYDVVKLLNVHERDKSKEKQHSYADDYYFACWITQPRSKSLDKELPFLSIRSNSAHFINGFVSDLKLTHHQEKSKIYKYALITKEAIKIHISGLEHLNNVDDISYRICFALYKKGDQRQKSNNNDPVVDPASGKVCTFSFDMNNILIHISLLSGRQHKRTKEVFDHTSFVISLPMADYCTKIGIDSDGDISSCKEHDVKSKKHQHMVQSLYTFGRVDLFCNSYIGSKNSVSKESPIYAPTLWSNYITATDIVFKRESYSPFLKAYLENPSQQNDITKFTDCLEFIIGDITKIENVELSNNFTSLFVILKQLGTLHVDPESLFVYEKGIFDVLEMHNVSTLLEWLKLQKATKDYIKHFCKHFDKDGTIDFTIDTSPSNKLNIKRELYKPDIPGLRKFKRIFWVIDNVKIPYPHYTKLCLPQIDPISLHPQIIKNNDPTDVHPFSHLDVIDENTEQLLVKLLTISCLKHGFQSTVDFVNIIEEAFSVTFNDIEDDESTWWFSVDKEMVSATVTSRRYIEKNTKERFLFLKCCEIIGDFLCSISCSMDYKFDMRSRRKTQKEQEDEIETGDKNPNKWSTSQDVDSLDFDALAGLNEEGDCDEAGIFIDYIFAILCNGKTTQNLKSTKETLKTLIYKKVWKDYGLRAATFICLQYVDFCNFGVVDEAKFEQQQQQSEDEKWSNQNSDANPDLLYNKYDRDHSCQTGHTFVILIPLCDLTDSYKSEYAIDFWTKTNHLKYLKEAHVILDKAISRVYTFAELEVEKYEMANYYSYVMDLARTLPRLLLEGTGRQSAIPLNGEFYHGKDSPYNNLNTNRSELIKSISKLYDVIIKENGKELIELKNMDTCDYQCHKTDKETYFESYYKRCIDFYRRSTQATSQMLRFIFDAKNNTTTTTAAMTKHIWENFVWIHQSHHEGKDGVDSKRWGVPIRFILDKSSHALPVPLSYQLYTSYTTDEGKQDLFMDAHLSSRLPHSNFSHFINLQKATSVPIKYPKTSISKEESTEIQKLMHNGSLLEKIFTLVSSPLQKCLDTENKNTDTVVADTGITIYWTKKLPHRHDNKIEYVANSIIHSYRATNMDLLLGCLQHIFKDTNIKVDLKIVQHATLPWFSQEFYVILTFKI